MAGASSLAEAVARALPARAPGAPVWPSASVSIRGIRGSFSCHFHRFALVTLHIRSIQQSLPLPLLVDHNISK